MRPTRTTILLSAGLVSLLGFPAGAASAAETLTDLYVNNQDDTKCSDAGAGTQAAPYCTITAATKVVQPGQTVRIATGRTYDEDFVVDRSGEPGKPITFVADQIGSAEVGLGQGKTLSVSGASHVVVRGVLSSSGVQVTRSSDVELDQIRASKGTLAAVVVGEASSDVRISRSLLSGVRVEGGSQRTVISRSMLWSGSGPVVRAVDAPGTVVTNNDLEGYCGSTVSIEGSSTGSGAFNNVFFTNAANTRCKSTDPRHAIAVSASAVAGTRADHNLIALNPALPFLPYSWSGNGYKDQAAFQAATGQGAADILPPTSDGIGKMEGSPTIDSADPTAPGVLPTDIDGDPTADDPRVPNTGKNGGHLDRGAYELQDALSRVLMHLAPAHAPVGTEVEVQAVSDSKWPTAMAYEVDFGDGSTPVVTKQGNGPHGLAKYVYSRPGDYVVKVAAVNGVGKKVFTENQIKVTAAGPLTAGFTATPLLPTSDNPIGRIAPLTVAIDTGASATPWPVERVTVDFGDGSFPGQDDQLGSIQHAYDRPGEYQVTVSLKDIKGAESKVTKSVKADYAPSGYVSSTPFRLLDTRPTGGRLRGGVPAAASMPVGLTMPGRVTSGGMASVVLNVTVTNATQDAFLAVSPYAQDRPTTSNLNVPAGGTVSNTVTVPVSALGQTWFTLNAGQADLIVDFVGYYQPNIGQKFSPINPARLADTRTEAGALGGGQTRTVKVAGVAGIPADVKAVAFNLTSTDATSNSFVVAYPDPAKRPDVSNLNPEPGKAKANQVIVPVAPDGTITLYNHWGSTHLIVDAVGYYGQDGKGLFTPVVPQRLGDTRVTGKLGAGTTTTVGGVPAGALGAVVNLTATESTGAGYLTAYGFGATRPDASSLNTLPGLTIPNHVTTPVGDGKINVYNGPWGGSTHVITDLLGYFTQG
ncbi:PKD domain-containing protein [Streptomyces sp. NBC_01351]|uniref:PKD domain-containing protein n=1 Tax=Streptomyces sp. NBC_01351 TaxID=2903833 RepID=UPI002E302451|nr:PKD domain-containing protein [Streptomyces sp. NBC_01351]